MIMKVFGGAQGVSPRRLLKKDGIPGDRRLDE
jgi:hypothetical protein